MENINDDIEAYLQQVVEEEQNHDHDGSMSSFMEEIGMADKEMFGVCVTSSEGKVRKGGNADEVLPLESVSKALALALALEDVGAEKIFQHVSKEPKGDPFHSIAALEEGDKGVPSNPMINAGAIAVTSMIQGADGEERFIRLRDFIRRLADNPAIDYNHDMYEAEEKDLNRALFYYMRSHGVVSGSEEDSLLPYMKQTSIEMSCVDLARIAAVFANNGKAPGSDEQLIAPDNVHIVLTLMFATGMYQSSGEFAVDVGIPAKSGISGFIMAVVPGRMGVGVIGPALDNSGNSIAGMRILGKLSKRWKLAAFSSH
ncbi:glutaminase A [Vreelandella populi]|uniref:Glutaminase n=1 Tax=Vreelandella populi TaxID=2498858 RepID=A0A3S1E7S2_9GAMM|nr:glutaminase A [Halomonas populi]RUR39285.1 glutaminase A [Halomonas populi]RUR46397.1 glutaminase A [Halomonas populi]